MAPYQCTLYPLEKCGTCDLRALWGCQGGCLSYTIARYGAHAAGESSAGACAGPAPLPDTRIAIAPDVTVRTHELPQTCFSIVRNGSAGPIEVGAAFAGVLKLLDGTRSASEIAAAFVESTAPGDGTSSVTRFVRRAASDGVHQLLAAMRSQGIIVERTA